MTEKIIYSPGKVAPATAPVTNPSGSLPQGRATDPRLFAEILAEAEAVQDHVELHGPYQAGRGPGALREMMQNALQGGIQGVAGLLNRTPHRSQAAREIKPRRKTG